ncbi:MAG: sugar nucleotide-binding protein [Nitrospirae bacterium]|nr:sugar nucleotide-binding protein [Nitrospirota bacterium]
MVITRQHLVPKTVIIGAGGFIGRHFLDAYRKTHSDLIGTTRAELDLLNPDIRALRLSENHYKEALILAAIPNIDRCEQEKELSTKVNVTGTLQIIRQLADEGIKPVFTSSDYVFGGNAGNYKDDAPLCPNTEYGRQKAEVESKIGEITNGNHLIIRLSKVYSHVKGDATMIDEMASCLAQGKTVKAACDQVFCPTFIDDVIAVTAILQGNGITGTVNLCPSKRVSRYDIAKALAEKMGIDEVHVDKISLDDMVFRVKRPKDTSMRNDRLTGILAGLTNYHFTDISESIGIVGGNWKK